MSENHVSRSVKSLYKKFLENTKSVRFRSMKHYLRSLLSSGSPEEKNLVQQWFDHKRGTLEKVAKALREETKGTLNKTIALATKTARRKKGAAGSTKTV